MLTNETFKSLDDLPVNIAKEGVTYNLYIHRRSEIWWVGYRNNTNMTVLAYEGGDTIEIAANNLLKIIGRQCSI